MNITIEKISDEKFEITIKDGETIIFNSSTYYNYMDEIVMDEEKVNDRIQHLSSLFGELNVIKNDFNI
jgi:hypothetical protein